MMYAHRLLTMIFLPHVSSEHFYLHTRYSWGVTFVWKVMRINLNSYLNPLQSIPPLRPPRFACKLCLRFHVFTAFFSLSKCSVYRSYTVKITCDVNRALSQDVFYHTRTKMFLPHASSEQLLLAHMLQVGCNFCLESEGYKYKPSPESSPVYTTVTPLVSLLVFLEFCSLS